MVTIGIDPGHGGSNVGCTAFGIHEETYTLALGIMVRDALKALGLGAIMSRHENESVSFKQRAERLAGADFVVVLHVNKAATPAPRDLRCYCIPDVFLLPETIGMEIERRSPAIVRPDSPTIRPAVKGTDTDHCYNVLAQHHPTPAVLVETFFASHPESAAYAKQPWGIASFANAIVAGILLAWQLLDAAKTQSEPAIAQVETSPEPVTEEVPT